MISRVRGVLLRCDSQVAEIMTSGGLAYQVEVPTFVAERLREGTDVELHTCQVVRDDAVLLFGFLKEHERSVFNRLLATAGVGPRLALAMVSSLTPERLVSAIVERNVALLCQVPGVGKKKAERLVLELADRLEDLVLVAGVPATGAVQEGTAALVALGYAPAEAAEAVRKVLAESERLAGTELIKAALARLSP